MAGGSPKERLSKLFHRHDTKKDEATSSPPPSSPSSAGFKGHVRKTSSRASLRDALHSRGRSDAKPGQRVSSGSSYQAPQYTPPAPPVPEPYPAARVAATKAMYPDEDFGNARMSDERATRVADERATRLPNVPHESDLSTDLQHLTMMDAVGNQPYSEDVADRNISKRRQGSVEARRAVFEQPSGGVGKAGSAKPLVPSAQAHSEDVANWNIVQNEKPLHHLQGAPAPLQTKKRGSVDPRTNNLGSSVSPTTPSDGHGLSRKSVVGNLRDSSDATRSGNPPVPIRSQRRSVDAGLRSDPIRRSNLQKSLPTAPSDEYAANLDRDRAVKNDLPEVHSALGKERGYLVKDAEKPVDLTGIVDLRNTEDTTLHETWAPAVTHETIIQDVHTIRGEQITREVHNHDVFHRVLPIVDIEVLPARHFVPVEGGYAEISNDEVPGRTGTKAQWVIAETVSKLLPESKDSIGPRQFTARKFEDKDGDYTESVAPEGFKRTEQSWVHPPSIETGGRETGQTYAFHIGSPNPAEDGLQAHLPAGDVIGVSPLLAQQQRERLGGQQQSESAMEEVNGGKPPPVPTHKVFPAEMVDSSRSGHTRPQIAHGFSFV